MDHERIIESEGLPFAYVINLMSEVKDILTLYGRTLVNQVEKVLNDEFEERWYGEGRREIIVIIMNVKIRKNLD